MKLSICWRPLRVISLGGIEMELSDNHGLESFLGLLEDLFFNFRVSWDLLRFTGLDILQLSKRKNRLLSSKGRVVSREVVRLTSI